MKVSTSSISALWQNSGRQAFLASARTGSGEGKSCSSGRMWVQWIGLRPCLLPGCALTAEPRQCMAPAGFCMLCVSTLVYLYCRPAVTAVLGCLNMFNMYGCTCCAARFAACLPNVFANLYVMVWASSRSDAMLLIRVQARSCAAALLAMASLRVARMG
jgi:hypothetical protein